MILKVLFILMLIPAALNANAAMNFYPASESGEIYTSEENSLRVISETISYDINNSDFTAAIKVEYNIINDGNSDFNGPVFFVTGKNGRRHFDTEFKLKINGRPVTAEMNTQNIDVSNTYGKAERLPYDGYIFKLNVKPKEKVFLSVSYKQGAGWEGGASIAEVSHFMNLGARSFSSFYTYHIFPIKTFGGGVDEVIIRVKYPLRDKDENDIEDFQSNVQLKVINETDRFCELEARFSGIPADNLDLSFFVSKAGKTGLTITPLYLFSFPDENNTWAGSVSLDYIMRNNRLSAGALYNFDDTLQLFQDIRFFPQGQAHYIEACIDFRLGPGIVQQLRPETDFGFRFIAGIRMFFALECIYQVFPPWITGKWNQEILVSMPFSF